MSIGILLKKKLNPDKRGRVSLKGLVADNIDCFEVEKMEDGTIILKPFIRISENESWLFKNPVALESVKIGIKQAKEGKILSRKSYSEFSDIEL